MTTPKVSVVVPIYKVEKYLRECVDSILGQSLREIEVILVDDGSPDACPEIVDDYAKRDRRVVAVHQENAGYSAAVNHGIALATGEYIGIIESDDWIEATMYEKLYRNAKKYETDVTKGMFTRYNSSLPVGTRDEVFRNALGIDLDLAPEGAFEITEWPQLTGFHASIWSAIYRAEFIKKIKIPETAGASYQDLPFAEDVYCRAKRISIVKEPFVHWRNDPDQENSTSANGAKLLLMVQNSQLAAEIIEKSGKMPQLKEAFYAQVMWANIGFVRRISGKYRREYYRKLKEVFGPVKDDEAFNFKHFRPLDKIYFRLITKRPYWILNLVFKAMNFRIWLAGVVKKVVRR